MQKWIVVDGIRTRYFEAGSGPPLVLVYRRKFRVRRGGVERHRLGPELRRPGRTLPRRRVRQARTGTHRQPAGRRLHDERRGPARQRLHPDAGTLRCPSRGPFARRLSGLPPDAGAARSGRVLHDHRQQHLRARPRAQRRRACGRAQTAPRPRMPEMGVRALLLQPASHRRRLSRRGGGGGEPAQVPGIRPQDGGRGSQDQDVPARPGEGQVGDVRLDPRPRHGQDRRRSSGGATIRRRRWSRAMRCST